jgi:hypothetical protein
MMDGVSTAARSVPRRPGRPGRRIGGVAAALCLLALPATAQTSRLALEAVAAADGAVDSTVSRKPTGWVDLFAAVRITDGLTAVARPLVTRRAFDGDWDFQMYELGVRYQRGARTAVRLNLGWQPSPVGQFLLENRPDLNPVVSLASAYYLPVPNFERGTPREFLIGASYPLAATVTVSGPGWDARASLMDRSPLRASALFGDAGIVKRPNVAIGAGVTPRIGLRFGLAYAQGAYAAKREVPDPATGDRTGRLLQAEGEWARGHTKVNGEYVYSTYEAPPGDAVAQGGWVEGTQTLAPRWFVAGRVDHQWLRWTRESTLARAREAYTRAEAVVGYRVTPSLTLRGGYLGRKGYVVFHWDDQLVGSVVWALKLR